MSKTNNFFKDIKNTLTEEFSSVQLAITLFIFLAITTLIGTVLPEEGAVGTSELVKKYGLQKYHILKSIGLTDVFHSWWYLSLLVALGINLIVCSARRVFPTLKRVWEWPKELKEDNIKKLPINCELPMSEHCQLDIVEKKLKEKKFRTRVVNNTVLGIKGSWHRFGSSVTHVGILLLLIGSGASIACGFNGFVQLQENEGFYLANLGNDETQIRSTEYGNWIVNISKMPVWFGGLPPYLVKVNKTWREDYETGQPKQWYSDLSVYDRGKNKKELKRKVIHVNDPLSFGGLDIYQSNWGKFARISFNNESFTLPLEKFGNEEIILLPLNNDVALKFLLTPHEVLEVYSVMLSNVMKQKPLGKVEMNEKLTLGPMNIGFLGTETLTGLQFKSNPGGFLMYSALFIIIIGVLIAFGSKKQIWATVNETDRKIIIGGVSDRAKEKFFNEFHEIISEILSEKEIKTGGIC